MLLCIRSSLSLATESRNGRWVVVTAAVVFVCSPAAAKKELAQSAVWKAAAATAQEDLRSVEQKKAELEREMAEREVCSKVHDLADLIQTENCYCGSCRCHKKLHF